jgi:hypothetical protein
MGGDGPIQRCARSPQAYVVQGHLSTCALTRRAQAGGDLPRAADREQRVALTRHASCYGVNCAVAALANTACSPLTNGALMPW